MTSIIKNVCVFSSSRSKPDKVFFDAARELGILMAQNGLNLIYGGGALGLMYENARAVKEFGGEVIGVIPEKLNVPEVGDGKCDKLIVTKCMRTRKGKIDEISDAAIAISGGFGTLEELAEIIVQKQLGYNSKAVVIINTNGFYDKLLEFFDEVVEKGFASEKAKEIYYVAKTPQEAIDYLKTYEPKSYDLKEKISSLA